MAIFLLKIIFFKKFKTPYLDRRLRIDICSWQCSSDRDKRVKQYGRQTGIVKIWTLFGKNFSFRNIIPVTHCLDNHNSQNKH